MKTQIETKHTPGPWRVRNGVNECFIDAPNIVCLAVVNSMTGLSEARADAQLIAAAPELLEALKMIMDAYGGDACECIQQPQHCPFCIAHQAIAKATGN